MITSDTVRETSSYGCCIIVVHTLQLC